MWSCRKGATRAELRAFGRLFDTLPCLVFSSVYRLMWTDLAPINSIMSMKNTGAPENDADWASFISATRAALPKDFTMFHTPRAGDIHSAIDHTIYPRPETDESIDQLCSEAQYHKLAAVTVSPKTVRRAVQNLQSSPDIAVACVISYPDGTASTSDKEKVTRGAVDQGATEIGLVTNRQVLKSGKYMAIYGEIVEVRKAAPSPIKLKVIVETIELTSDEVVAGTVIASMAGADFVQTNTGTKNQIPTIETVGLMRSTVDAIGKGTKIKATGFYRTADQCIQAMKAGADRVASSASADILQELGSEELYEQGVGHSMY